MRSPRKRKPLTEVERVVDTFIAPSKTFTDIRRNANWLVPWVLISIFGLLMVFTVDKKLGMDAAYENQLGSVRSRRTGSILCRQTRKPRQYKLGASITRYSRTGRR